MPGGKLHYPFWVPYELYGKVDLVYSPAAYHARNGWTGAQGLINVVETLAYFVYLYIVYAYGEQDNVQGRGAPDKNIMGRLQALSESRTLSGKPAAIAVMLCYSTALVTFSKTVLYCKS